MSTAYTHRAGRVTETAAERGLTLVFSKGEQCHGLTFRVRKDVLFLQCFEFCTMRSSDSIKNVDCGVLQAMSEELAGQVVHRVTHYLLTMDANLKTRTFTL